MSYWFRTQAFSLFLLLILALATTEFMLDAARADSLATGPSGILSGEFSVDRVGAATYRIAIDLPPGTAGVLPVLGLNYDSHSPPGIAGVGWSLSGLSSISRCSVRRNGRTHPVAYGKDDRFCLNGALLVAAPGSSYGADGAVYFLEKQPWVRVTSHGACPAGGAAGPCRFSAEQPTGEGFEFGATADSAIEAVPDNSAADGFPRGAIRVWTLSKQTDLNGNFVEYHYSEDVATGEYVPSSVRYTGNDRASVPLHPQRAVSFTFKDVAAGEVFQGGARLVRSKRLERIESCVAPVAVDRCDDDSVVGLLQVAAYDLDYSSSPATGRDLLTGITQIGADGAELPTQTFSYQAPERNAFQEPNVWSREFTWDDGWTDLASQERKVADINGDGRFDLIGFGQARTKYSLSEGTHFATSSSQAMFGVEQGYSDTNRFPRLIADVNGDGRSDIIGFGNDHVQVSRSLGTRYEKPENWSNKLTWGSNGWEGASTIRSVSDINGDGRSDIIGFGQTKLVFQLSTGDGFATAVTKKHQFTTSAGYQTPAGNPRFMADVNGDGRADIVGFKSKGVVEVGLSIGADFTAAAPWTDQFTSGSQSGWIVGQNPRFVVDLNGDGRSDLVGFRDKEVVVSFSTGRSFTDPRVWTTDFTFENGGWDDTKGTLRTLGDVNGDRLPDIIGFGNTNMSFGINRMTTFDTELFDGIEGRFGFPSIGRNPRFPADTTGVGISALIGLGDNEVIVAQPPSPKPDLLKGIVNELGGTVAISHTTTASGEDGLYSGPVSQWAYPYRSSTGPVDVVSAHEYGDGLGSTYRYAHAFQGAVADLSGRGFLGFETATLTDLQMNPKAAKPGVATTTGYYLEFPQTGSQRSIESRVVDSNRISARFEYDFQQVEIVAGVFDVRKMSEIGTHYTLANALSYQTRQNYTYDEFGNLALLEDLGNIRDPKDNSSICVNFSNDRKAWQIGFPLDSATGPMCSISQGVCSCANAMTRDQWTYTKDGRRNTATHGQFDSTKNGWLGEAFTYDDYGNVKVLAGATWGDAAGKTKPTTFNPLVTEPDRVYRTFPANVSNPFFGTKSQFDPRFGVRTSHTGVNGVTLTSTYDGFGRPLTLSGPAPNKSQIVLKSWKYDRLSNGSVTTGTDLIDWSGKTAWTRDIADGLSRVYRHERQSAESCVIATEQKFVSMRRIAKASQPFYTDDGGMTCRKAGAPVYVEHRYDALGRLLESRRADGTITRFDIDLALLNGIERDRVIETKAYGTMQARAYATYLSNSRKPLRWVLPKRDTAAANPIADLTYDAIGRLTRINAPKGVFTEWKLDSLSRPRTSDSASSGQVAFEYAPPGQLIREMDAEGRAVTWTHDRIGRILTETLSGPGQAEPDVTTFAYDQKQFSYPIGRLTSVENAAGKLKHTYDYDPYGNRQQSKLAIDGHNFAIQVDFDPLNRASLLAFPDGAKQRKTYSIGGFLTEVAVCGTVSECAGDAFTAYANYRDHTALGSPGTSAYLAGKTSITNYRYDVLGRVVGYATSSSDAAPLIKQEFDWDRLDRLLASTDGLDAARSLAFEYDGSGYLKSSRIGSRKTAYSYDDIGNLVRKGNLALTTDIVRVVSATREGTEVFSARYDKTGNMVQRSVTDSKGVRTQWTQTYDSRNRITRIEGQGAGGLTEFAYDYLGSMVKRKDTVTGTTSYYVSKNFDIAVLKDTSVVYTKYVDGLTTPVAAISTRAPDLADQLPQSPADRWAGIDRASPDARTIRKGTFGSGSFMLFALAVFIFSVSLSIVGLRPRRRHRLGSLIGDAARSGFVVFLSACLLITQSGLQVRAAGGLEAGVNGPGIPVAGKTLFFHTDQIRSTVLVTDASGTAQTEIVYGPYGEIDEATSYGPDDFRAKFAGQELQADAGLYLNGGRFYDPMVGRFVSADTNTFGAQTDKAVAFNRYAYAANNPVTNIDPTGQSALSIFEDIVIAAVVVTVAVIGGPGVAMAELGAYFGGAAVNHGFDPAKWNYKSWKTYGGIAAGIAISEAGAAISIAAPEAILAESGALATFAGGVVGGAAAGFGENAAFAALGGASKDEILKQGLIGAAAGGAFAVVGQGLSAGLRRVASRWSADAAEAGEESASLGSRAGSRVEREGAEAESESIMSCNSFAAGTLVATPGGLRAIETLELGDLVIAADVAVGRVEEKRVTALYSRTVQNSVEISTDGGQTITATGEHPFLLTNGDWVDARDLREGNEIWTGDNGSPVALASVGLVTGAVRVHNISVADLHTFLVSSQGLIVHNPDRGSCGANARELRSNMNKSNRKEPEFANSAHHIVESGDKSFFMVKAREKLAKMGVDINEQTNGVFLARSSKVQASVDKQSNWANAYPHSRVHTKNYKNYVWVSVDAAKSAGGVRKVLRKIRRELKSGSLPIKLRD